MKSLKASTNRSYAPSRRSNLNRSKSGNVFIIVFLCLAGLIFVLPLYYAVVCSLKPLNELWVFPPRLYVINPTLKNFSDLFTLMGSSTVPFSRYLFNTFFITITGTAGQIVIGSMAAYPLAKHHFPGRTVYFKTVVTALMFNTTVTAIPTYLIMAKLGWIDTYYSLIIPVFGSTLGVYLMKQFMERIHDSILEAAKIDGAGEARIFWTIVMPQVKPAWLTLMLFAIQGLWNIGSNNYIYSENLKTFPYALSQIVAGGIARAGVGSAVTVLMLLFPLLVFIFTQSNVIETMTTSGMKDG